MLKLLGLLLLVSNIWPLASGAANDPEPLEALQAPAKGLNSLHLINPIGDVSLAPSSSPHVKVILRKHNWGPRCAVTQTRTGGEWRLEISDKDWLRDFECRVEFLVSLPAHISVMVRLETGNLRAVDLKGSLSAEIASGHTTLKGSFNNVVLVSDVGNIDFQGSAPDVDLSTKQGRVDVGLDSVGAGQTLKLRLDQGDAYVSLPEKTRVLAQTATGNGLIKNDFMPTTLELPLKSKDAPLNIDARTQSGDIQILSHTHTNSF